MNFRLWSAVVGSTLSTTLSQICAVGTIAQFSSPLVAQSVPTVRIGEAPSCARCTIRLDKEVTIGDLNGPGSFVRYSVTLSRDSRGRLLVSDPGAPVPLLFESTGKFIGAVARQGQGPGEISKGVDALFTRGDTIMIVERGSLSFFAPNLTFVRKVQTPTVAVNFWALPSGNLFYFGSMRTPATAAFCYHILSETGTHIRSFVESVRSGTCTPEPGVITQHALSRTQGQFWTHTSRQYRFTLNDSVGVPKRVFEGTPTWFTESKKKGESPIVRAVLEDSRRILWVIGLTPSPSYKPLDLNADVISVRPENPANDRETTLDAIDLDTGAIIASVRIPTFVVRFVDDQRIAVLKETAGGIPQTEIWRFGLSGYSR